MNRSRYTVKNDNVFRNAKLQVSAYRLKLLEAERAECFSFLVKGHVLQTTETGAFILMLHWISLTDNVAQLQGGDLSGLSV